MQVPGGFPDPAAVGVAGRERDDASSLWVLRAVLPIAKY